MRGTMTKQIITTPPTGDHYPFQAVPVPPSTRPYRIPFSNIQHVGFKRPASREANQESPKKSKVETPYENVSPASEINENHVPPEIMDELFYAPLN